MRFLEMRPFRETAITGDDIAVIDDAKLSLPIGATFTECSSIITSSGCRLELLLQERVSPDGALMGAVCTTGESFWNNCCNASSSFSIVIQVDNWLEGVGDKGIVAAFIKASSKRAISVLSSVGTGERGNKESWEGFKSECEKSIAARGRFDRLMKAGLRFS